MSRKFFDTLWIVGKVFAIVATPKTPTEHAHATFRLSYAYGECRPEATVVWLWTGMGNGAKHAGDSAPSVDSREAVPTNDPRRSGRATRDGWQAVAIQNSDNLTASFVSRSVDDSRFVSHLAALLVQKQYLVDGIARPMLIEGATRVDTGISRTGVPYAPIVRKTEANTATKRASVGGGFMARDGGSNPLLDWRRE